MFLFSGKRRILSEMAMFSIFYNTDIHVSVKNKNCVAITTWDKDGRDCKGICPTKNVTFTETRRS
jgi:hypothetical protein